MKTSQPLVPSLLDRLIDDAPEDLSNHSRSYTWRDMRQSVRRDLENLLNAKMTWVIWPKCYPELDRSLLAYGLPDFSAMPLSSQDGRQRLCRIIEETIQKFEPRFADVAVTVVGESEHVDRILRLRIHALFHATPEAEEVTFDSEVEPVSLGIRIRES
ncbi:type VI secretion system baseplate subunit TssE [Photobacterium lutimaris]|uniref:Type VI secretion system baseplate subunit TssE n=1 Tax=Photobacterium lutimaris TaxID=388278 RepID=A0A2T3IZL9_9GAMM|nr:type VI secretion system baseplate subunit TssE [Photobacterium lutimaris]PSU34136.1 type VI secretion system baseplate subunit TssE [Photobacterium lutimaris]TDR75709.1 type VI secretion system protein ImpF [Photobacterium lutimaris]